MQALPAALTALGQFRQFILWKAVPSKKKAGKFDKLPVDPRTLQVYAKGIDWQKDPDAQTDFKTAQSLAELCGPDHEVGFLFTEKDPFFFLDIDNCLLPDNTWSPVALDLMQRFKGAAVEVSQSGTGLHIFARGTRPDHGCTNKPLGLELYTENRFVALTGTKALGDAGIDCSAQLATAVRDYFAPKATAKDVTWSTEPVPEWTGPEDDGELIEKALASSSVASTFGEKCTFKQLWEADEDALAVAFPDNDGQRAYDGNAPDMALAQHLAFWTGNNCERIAILMWQSGLVRDKWEREDYIPRTVLKAVSLQETVYSVSDAEVDDPIAKQFGAPKFKGSEKQVRWANQIRAEKLVACLGDEDLITALCTPHGLTARPSFWVDNKDSTPEQIAVQAAPVQTAGEIMNHSADAITTEGYQYLGVTQQIEHFKGCVYLQEMHRILTPTGTLLKSEQFNATFGGYSFQVESSGGKTTRKAWEAFTESQVVRFPKAEKMSFDPLQEPGAITSKDGHTFVNTYLPIETPSKAGDAAPFLTHLAKVLPDLQDQRVLLAYMAACVQHKGYKFQWAPVLQGVEGNGKTLFTRCVKEAIGARYTHMPKASKIDSEFNGWLLKKLFIGVEDIFIPEANRDLIEVLKPMITGGDGLEIQFKGIDQVTADVCCNFMLNCNRKNSVRKTRNDRRFAIFFTAQQKFDDLKRDGMDGDYFPNLYDWLKNLDGYAIVTNFLENYAIPVELNPALEIGGKAKRAPHTSSTDLAIASALGSVEQEILEAIELGRPGFANGWVSSMALEKLLQSLHKSAAIPQNRRREMLLDLGYDWHPNLDRGRVNNYVEIDGGKPRLFIRTGHLHCNLTKAASIVEAYQKDQKAAATGTAAEHFPEDVKK